MIFYLKESVVEKIAYSVDMATKVSIDMMDTDPRFNLFKINKPLLSELLNEIFIYYMDLFPMHIFPSAIKLCINFMPLVYYNNINKICHPKYEIRISKLNDVYVFDLKKNI